MTRGDPNRGRFSPLAFLEVFTMLFVLIRGLTWLMTRSPVVVASAFWESVFQTVLLELGIASGVLWALKRYLRWRTPKLHRRAWAM